MGGGGVHAWPGGMCGGRHAWLGVCAWPEGGGMHGRGACLAKGGPCMGKGVCMVKGGMNGKWG